MSSSSGQPGFNLIGFSNNSLNRASSRGLNVPHLINGPPWGASCAMVTGFALRPVTFSPTHSRNVLVATSEWHWLDSPRSRLNALAFSFFRDFCFGLRHFFTRTVLLVCASRWQEVMSLSCPHSNFARTESSWFTTLGFALPTVSRPLCSRTSKGPLCSIKYEYLCL